MPIKQILFFVYYFLLLAGFIASNKGIYRRKEKKYIKLAEARQ